MAGRPPEKTCCRRRWQGFMIYVHGPKKLYPFLNNFFNNYGVNFPLQDGAVCKNPVATDRWWGKEYELFLDADSNQVENIDHAITTFRLWLDKQNGVAPSGSECSKKSYEYIEMMKAEK